VVPTDVAAASAAVADARPAAAPLLKTSMPAAAAVLSQAAPHVQTPGVTPAPAPGQHAPPAAQPAPVIEITIGRVEVRAVRSPSTAQSPSPARAAQPPRLSLDEYLRPRPGSAG
jgi:hypothetical protein